MRHWKRVSTIVQGTVISGQSVTGPVVIGKAKSFYVEIKVMTSAHSLRVVTKTYLY